MKQRYRQYRVFFSVVVTARDEEQAFNEAALEIAEGSGPETEEAVLVDEHREDEL